MNKILQTLARQLWKRLAFGISLLAFFLLFAGSAKAQDPAQYGTPFTGVPDIRDVNIYQVHNRPYSAAGNFAGITARLDAIKALGTNVVYIMPIYPHGTDSKSSASPYCIKDYKSIATEYGTLADFQNLVAGCHSRGMAVILDIAINGTSWDHAWITAHPDWYIQSGGAIQQLANFPDIAALDFSNTSMRAALVDAMRYWIFAANIDGYRCDFANNPPIDFWTNTIANLRGITTHKLIMLAEGDRQANYTAGFDYDFGDDFYYDALKPISTGGSVSSIATTTTTEYQSATGSQMMARYTSNHDVETTTTAIQQFGGHAGVVANYLVCAYMRGVPFLTSGQEVDFNQTIPWPYTTVKIDFTANTGAAADFTKVINYRNSSEAIRRGTMTEYSNANVCAFTKISNTTTEKVCVMVNMRNSSQTFVIPSAMAGSYKDAYTGAAITLTSGATQTLTAFQYIVATNQNVATVAVTGVTMSPTTASVKAGLTTQLTATIAPSNATNQNVTWTSSNTAIATVSSTGLVTGVAAGTATITVKTADGSKTATCAVTVTAAATFTVYFAKPSGWGNTIDIYWWSAMPAGVLADGTWPGVAMSGPANGYYSYTFTNVTNTNLIFDDGTNQTANLNRGTTGWYVNGTWYDTNPGTPVPVTGVTVSPTSATLAVGATQQVTATIAPSNATNTAVTWSSSNTAAANVNTTGLVTAVAAGTATITVTTSDGSKTATCAITVSPVAVTGVTVSPTSASIVAGATQQLTATVAPSNATNKAVTWTSGNTAVATVNTAGLVTAVAAGTATVTVKTTDGSKTATCAVTVTASGTSTTYYNILNRWQANTYLYDGGNGQVKYGTSPSGNTAYQWAQVSAGSGFIYLKNRSTGNLMNVEDQNGAVEANAANTTWYSAMWTLASTGDGWNYIENRWQTSEWIHIENLDGYAQYASPQTGWYSAEWQFVNSTVVTNAMAANKNTTFDLQLGSSSLGTNSFGSNNTAVLYPNPAPGNYFNITIKGRENEPFTVTVYNLFGAKMLTAPVSHSGQVQHNLKSGDYIVKIRMNDNTQFTKRLLIP